MQRTVFHIPAIALLPILIIAFSSLIFVTFSKILQNYDISFVWNLIYVAGGAYIIQRVKRGYLYEPIVLVGGSYLSALVIGELMYTFFKDRDYGFLGLNYTGLGFASFLLGAYITQKYNFIFSKQGLVTKPFTFHPAANYRLLWGVAAACLVITVTLFARAGTIPILSSNPAQAKMNFFAGNGLFSVFLKGIPFICIALLYDSLVAPKPGKFFRLNILTGIYIFITVLIGFRSTIVVFLVQYISVYWMFNRKTIPVSLILSAIIGLLILVSLVGAFRRGSLTLADFTHEIGITLVARPVVFELILKNYNEDKFAYGARYLEDLKKLLPGEQTGANVDLKFEIFKGFADMPDTAGITPSIIGEAYINFGHYGIMGICLACGLIASYFYTRARKKPNFFYICFLTHITLFLVVSIISGIGTALINFMIGLIWTIFLSVLYEHKIKL
ncbi:MAG: oligosaccharide repeat unit polymerase [Bacteroidia bacterium]|nr:oligosaccharide repeat unit polymerase [Bacteroidia bacterium]